jgi:hypothetical protein
MCENTATTRVELATMVAEFKARRSPPATIVSLGAQTADGYPQTGRPFRKCSRKQKHAEGRKRAAEAKRGEDICAADIFYSCVFSTRTCPLSVIRLRHGRAHTRALVQREPPALSVVRQQLTRLPRPRGIVRYRHHVDEHRREVARRREKRTARRRVAVD